MKRLISTLACIALLFAPILLSQQGYIPSATDFDGTGDYYLRGGDLTGNANGKLGAVSFWFRVDGDTGTTRFALQNAGARFSVEFTSGDAIRVTAGPGDASILDISTSTTVASGMWQHLHASWDVGNATALVYLDGVDVTTATTLVDSVIDYTRVDWSIGATIAGASKLNGAISEFYFALEYIDLSIEANRRKFITADGKPVDLGPGCYKPTGTVAIICMQTQFNNFGNNSGSGGDFTPQDPVTWTAGPVPILPLAGRAGAHALGRGDRSQSRP